MAKRPEIFLNEAPFHTHIIIIHNNSKLKKIILLLRNNNTMSDYYYVTRLRILKIAKFILSMKYLCIYF